MQFYAADKIYNLNRYGIEEPKAIGKPRPANSFDLLLIPLVAFDRSGTRMGMGAGRSRIYSYIAEKIQNDEISKINGQ